MKKLLLSGLLFVFSSALFASNQPGEEAPWPTLRESTPAWGMLENLTPAERNNAIIQIELSSNANSEAVQHARLVEDKWNNGNYDEAIKLFQQFTDLNDAAIGIQWKEPITTSSSPKWGTDVQIGTDDSIYVVDLDVDNITGHLFSVLLHPSGGYYSWDVYFSADTGKTWSKTYTWPSSYYITDVSCAVTWNRFYVAYVYDGAPTNARLRRFYTSDGSSDATYGYHTVNTEGSNIKDVSLASNADSYNNRIYYLDILANDSLKFYWDDTTATSWTPVDPSIGNAYKGLDATWNEGFSTYYLWVSYIGTDYKIYVAGIDYTDSWYNFGALDTSYIFPGVSSIGAYKDTVITVYKSAYSPNRAVYTITYSGGSSWLYGTISDSLTYGFDVTSRGGDGMGVAYIQYYNGWVGMYRHRTYTNANPWTTPVTFADYEPRIVVKPAIERVASGIYGIVYADYPSQNAYFDRSDFVGINENPDIETNVIKLLGNYPNPFSHYTTIKYQITKRVNISLRVYDISGKLVKTIVEGEKGPGSYTATWNGINNDGNKVSSGVYFYRLSTGNAGASKKMILLK